MENETLVNAIQESLPENVTPESLPEKADVTQEPSPAAPVETPTPKAEQKETPFHEHPRWIERQKELELLRQQNQQLMELVQASQKQSSKPQVDPYDGMSAEEKAFYQRIDKIAEEKARKIIAEEKPAFQQELQHTKETIAALAYERFLAKYPEVKPGSEEEAKIANFYRRGYSLDDARNLVFREWDIEKAANKGKTQQTVKTQQKIAANMEQASIPAISGLPTKNTNFREAMRKNMDAAGL